MSCSNVGESVRVPGWCVCTVSVQESGCVDIWCVCLGMDLMVYVRARVCQGVRLSVCLMSVCVSLSTWVCT